MPRRFHVAVLGGTFDRLHAGHRALLLGGLDAAEMLGIGITTDEYLDGAEKPLRGKIQPYETRYRALTRYLRTVAPARRWWVVPLGDGWGRSVEPGIDAIVATEETAPGVASVNRERQRRRLPALSVVTVPVVRGADGLPVSSRRIRAGKIHPNGRRAVPLQVRVVGAPSDAHPEIADALRARLPEATVRFVRGRSPVRTRTGLRAAEPAAERSAAEALGRGEYGIGVAPVRATRRRSSVPPAWMLGIRDPFGPVGSPVLVAGGEWARAFDVLFAERSGPRPRP